MFISGWFFFVEAAVVIECNRNYCIFIIVRISSELRKLEFMNILWRKQILLGSPEIVFNFAKQIILRLHPAKIIIGWPIERKVGAWMRGLGEL